MPKDLSDEAKARRATERETLTQQADQLEAELARQFTALGRARRALSVTVKDVQKALSRDGVLLEFIRYTHYLGKDQSESRYGAVLIPRTGEPQWVPLGSAAAIEQNIARYQQLVRGSAPFGVPASAGPDRPKAGHQTNTVPASNTPPTPGNPLTRPADTLSPSDGERDGVHCRLV